MIVPPPIRTNDNAFANNTMRVRIPGIIRDTIRLNPDLPPEALDRLHLLAVEIENDAPLPMLQYPAPDTADWLAAWRARDGDTWQNTDWFFAETFFYRHLIEIVDWFRSGRDPYLPKKREEYESAAMWGTVRRTLEIRESDLAPEEKLTALVYAALWGNSIDLSYARAASHGASRRMEDLVIDETAYLIDHLAVTHESGQIDIVLDNTGTELMLDLILVDALLDGWASNIVLHAKQHPTFVSDAIPNDIFDALARMRERGGIEHTVSDRLSAALQEGAIEVRPDWFWNSSHFLWEKPDLRELFGASSLVISKGDANFRRAIGDALWETTTPFSQAVRYFPAPLAVLRTLKSDPIIGLRGDQEEVLNRIDPDWRHSGQRGMVAFEI